jgi:hypothetical protein
MMMPRPPISSGLVRLIDHLGGLFDLARIAIKMWNDNRAN